MAAVDDFARHPRPESWYPFVFTDPRQVAEAGLCEILQGD